MEPGNSWMRSKTTSIGGCERSGPTAVIAANWNNGSGTCVRDAANAESIWRSLPSQPQEPLPCCPGVGSLKELSLGLVVLAVFPKIMKHCVKPAKRSYLFP